MPLTHVRTFCVRYYECGADGQVHHANYLRYVQEAAFDASAAAGYDAARYEAIGRIWLVRKTDLEVLAPLHYGDRVQVKTWVAEFRRVRSCRAYEMRHEGSGALVARAHTDWGFLDRTTGRPAAIPADMMASLSAEGVPQTMLPRTRFPASPPPPPGALRRRRCVEWSEVDPAQHVNNAAYLAYLEDCHVHAAVALGWNPAQMQAQGLAIRAQRHQIEYQLPATAGDELEIVTWASDVQETTGLWHAMIVRVGDGATLARGRTAWACVELDSDEPACLPAWFRAAAMVT